MNIYFLPTFLTSLIVLSLGVVVYFKNKSSNPNIAFAKLTISLFVWLFCYSLMYLSNSPQIAIKYARVGFIGITFIPIFTFEFVLYLLKLEQKNLSYCCIQ